MYKNTYALKLRLNIVTARIEALVSGNKFLFVSKKSAACELSHVFDNFYELFIIVEAL
jgi:hypothetical protein